MPLEAGRKCNFCIWARIASGMDQPASARAIMTVQSNITSIVSPVASATVEVVASGWTRVCLNDVTVPRTSRYFFAMRFLDVAQYMLDDITVECSASSP